MHRRRVSLLESIAVRMPKSLEQLSSREIERKRCISRVMTHTLDQLTREFLNQGFEWLLPVILSKSTDPLWPDPGASIEKRIEVEIYGKTVNATASMIVHKMIACSLAHPKLFILSPNIRIEKRDRAHSGIHAYEFTQLDFEVRNASSEHIRRLVDGVISRLVSNVKKDMKDELKDLDRYNELKTPKTPFRVFDKQKLEIKYGPAWENRAISRSREPFWVTNVPREFYDFEDSAEGTWDNYDLMLPGYGEVLSGAKREWEHDKIVAKMKRDGVLAENYEELLALAKHGKLKPSAGGGVGIERLVSWITGAKHIAETQLFPKIPGMVNDL